MGQEIEDSKFAKRDFEAFQECLLVVGSAENLIPKLEERGYGWLEAAPPGAEGAALR